LRLRVLKNFSMACNGSLSGQFSSFHANLGFAFIFYKQL